MDGSGICGLRFSVYYASPRTSFYAEPYHVCSYHGIETDLLNLTTCVGYEIWRVSTTCTLVLESVKATSIVFLLGVGSFVCYKLYHRYKRRSSSSPDSKKKKRATSWVTKELLDTRWIKEEDLHEIQREYFGPANYGDDSSSSGSELGHLTTSLSSSRRCQSKFVEEKRISRPKPYKRMGHNHSSTCPYESVAYNVRTGVHLFGASGPLLAVRGPASFSLPLTLVRSRNQSSDVEGPTLNTACTSTEDILPCRPQRPKTLLLDQRKDKRRLGVEGHNLVVVGTALKSLPRSEVGPELQFESEDSLESGCSSRYCSEEEGLNADGDDEEEDDEEDFLRSSLQLSQDDGQFSRSRSGSLKGNFSPRSLLNRHLVIAPMSQPQDEALPSVDLHCLADQTETPDAERSGRLPSDHDSDPVGIEKRDTLNYDDTLSSLGLGSTGGRSPYSPHHHHYRLVRDGSFGSEGSEVSLDTSAFNDIGRSTEAEIDRIQREIEVVKRDFLDLECCMGNVDFHGPTPTVYTELVKSPLLDISEGSDEAQFELLGTPHSRKEQLSGHRSANSSLDRVSPTSGSVAINNSGNLSLEWDPMHSGSGIGGSGDAVSVVIGDAQCGTKCTSRNGVAGMDSGSDFGTPLTNGSPEPTVRGRSGSTVSLEWEEEFGHSPSANMDLVDEDLVSHRTRTCNAIGPVPARLAPSSTPRSELLNESNAVAHSWRRAPRETTTTPSSSSLVINVAEPKMWSSMESGYIDEFSESCTTSQQVTPVVDGGGLSLTSSLKASKPLGGSAVAVKKDPNVDSAYHEGTELEEIRTWPVVGPKLKANELYSSSKDFASVCHRSGFRYLRPIHKDGYSIVRAVLLQMLSQGYSALEHSGGVDNVKRRFSLWVRCHHPWLTQWSFARKLIYNPENCFQGMLDCLQTLDWLTNCVLSSANKEQTAVDILNTDPDVEVKAMEAMKLLMLKSVLDMHEALAVDKPVPVFALLLFARETSREPHSFMLNHLNHIGESRELDDLELYVLGNAVGVTICILHPGTKRDQDDAVTYHPDSSIGSWPEIHLVFRENLQQYCVILR